MHRPPARTRSETTEIPDDRGYVEKRALPGEYNQRQGDLKEPYFPQGPLPLVWKEKHTPEAQEKREGEAVIS
jgi:hypothetical protein